MRNEEKKDKVTKVMRQKKKLQKRTEGVKH